MNHSTPAQDMAEQAFSLESPDWNDSSWFSIWSHLKSLFPNGNAQRVLQSPAQPNPYYFSPSATAKFMRRRRQRVRQRRRRKAMHAMAAYEKLPISRSTQTEPVQSSSSRSTASRRIRQHLKRAEKRAEKRCMAVSADDKDTLESDSWSLEHLNDSDSGAMAETDLSPLLSSQIPSGAEIHSQNVFKKQSPERFAHHYH